MLPLFLVLFWLLLLDGLWLGWLSYDIYFRYLNHFIQLTDGRMDINLLAAGVVYVTIMVGIVVFVLPRAQGDVILAGGYGALFGMVTYAIYNFTNLAVLASWPWQICIIDTLWGMVLCGLTSALTVACMRYFTT